MALKIKSISGIEDIVVSFADSANNVPAIGIYGLETSGNIEKVIEDDKVILVGQDYVGKGVITINDNKISADLSDYYNVDEVNDLLDEKQDIIKDKKDSSIPYLETVNSEPSWEVIESSQINAHGIAVEGELYDIPINGRTYKVVCLNGKLWLAENYVDTTKAFYTNSTYGSYFTKSQIANAIPQGWHLPTKEEFQELIDAETEHCEKYLSTTDWHQGTDYATGTNELKLNILPGSEYNPGRQEISSEYYQARFWTSTDEILSQSTVKQRVYVKISNYIGYNSKIISFDWDGPGSTYYFTIRLIKDDLEVPAHDGWKKFNGKNFMAIADDEGNTFKDFYLKKVEAQATYQPKGDYVSSADVTVLNTYYGLTTTGWKDISTNYYDKQAVDNMIAGAYVPLSAAKCIIGSGNVITTAANYTELAQGYDNTAKEHSFAQGSANSANVKSFAQGVLNFVNSTALAQGDSNSGDIYSFMQGLRNSAHYASLAQGEANSAIFYSQAQGIRNYAHNFSLAVGSANSGYERGISLGLRSSAHYTSLAVGDDNWCDFDSFTLGTKCSASNKGLSVGLKNSAYMQSFAQGDECSAKDKGFAQGEKCYAYNYGFAQGANASANNYCALAQGYNVSANYDSLAQGNTVRAGDTACAQGFNVTALTGSLAQGKNCSAQDYSLSQGLNNTAGYYSQALGQTNSAVNWSTTIGLANTAMDYSFAGGSGNEAHTFAFTYGSENSAAGDHEFVIGSGNKVNGSKCKFAGGIGNTLYDGSSGASFAYGINNTIRFDASIALGTNNNVQTSNGVVIGDSNYVNALYAVAIGRGLTANQNGQIVLGKYNASSNDASDLLIVGNGQGIGYQPTNAMVVKTNGLVSAVNLKTSAGQVMTEPTLTAGKQYSYTTTGWHEFTLPEVPTISAKNGITATTGTGADTGKIIVGIDTTNYKLLTTAEYAELTAAVAIISANSGRWVLTPAS